jgi:biotin carboxyl carrier protein
MYKVQVQDQVFEVEKSHEKLILDGNLFEADILEYKPGKFHLLVKGKSLTAEILHFNAEEKTAEVKVDNSVFHISIKDQYDELLQRMGIDATAGKKVNDIKAPMPGMVLNVMVENGQQIKKGDAIVVLEAMKMENILKSPADGIIEKIHVFKGDKVEKNQIMVNLG